MNRARLELVRKTRLDLAQWIASGMAGCRSQTTSICLARYAAAQLEGAALIAHHNIHPERGAHSSLLRNELNRLGRNQSDWIATLTRVSRAMLRTLAGGSAQERRAARSDILVARLIQIEVIALKTLMETLPGRAAA